MLSDSNKGRGLFALLHDINIWVAVYKKLSTRSSAGTPGVDRGTIDSTSLKFLINLKDKIIQGKYKHSNVRRVFIPKPSSSKMRPLGIPTFSDRIVQGVMKEVMEPIFETKFVKNSFGFRPGLSQLNAISFIKTDFRSINWFIEGDFEDFFNNVDHKLLFELLSKKIEDKKFLRLLKDIIKSPITMPNGSIVKVKRGLPQGGLISPLLSNIYLHIFDEYILDLKIKFDSGISRAKNKDYFNTYMRARRNGKPKPKNINSVNYMDDNYKRIFYCRYADDWIIGVCGSKADCEFIVTEIKKITKYLRLNFKYLRIVHGRKESVDFLGYKISSIDKKKTRSGKNIGSLRFLIPTEKVLNRLSSFGFCKPNGEHIPCFKWYYLPTSTINVRVKAFLNSFAYYYQLSSNLTMTLNRFDYIIRSSIAKMYAAKLKLKTRAKVYKIHGRGLNLNFKYEGSILYLGYKNFREIPKSVMFYSEPTEDLKDTFDILKWNTIRGINLFKEPCKVCGSDENIEMHHVKNLKDNKTGNIYNRKVIPLCREHHLEIHGLRNKNNG